MSINAEGKLPPWGILSLIEAYLLADILSGPYCIFFIVSCFKISLPPHEVRAPLMTASGERKGLQDNRQSERDSQTLDEKFCWYGSFWYQKFSDAGLFFEYFQNSHWNCKDPTHHRRNLMSHPCMGSPRQPSCGSVSPSSDDTMQAENSFSLQYAWLSRRIMRILILSPCLSVRSKKAAEFSVRCYACHKSNLGAFAGSLFLSGGNKEDRRGIRGGGRGGGKNEQVGWNSWKISWKYFTNFQELPRLKLLYSFDGVKCSGCSISLRTWVGWLLGWLRFWMLHHLAQLLSFYQNPICPCRIGQIAEHPISQSTQPKSASWWHTV